mmetsp:Transcript_1064/g.2433  ORF Transcript_1064/g.2433 Transcript_1064/m.2433 type:complete len:872 (+) Transcript_1064:90-2705(+)
MDGIRKIVVGLSFLSQVVPSVATTGDIVYDGGKALLEASQNHSIFWGMQCTTRYGNEVSEVTGNSTEELDVFLEFEESAATFPNCPEGYFCDVQIAGNEEKTDDDVLGHCIPCSGGPDTCALVVNATSQDFLAQTTLAECQKQCGVEQNTCLSMEECNLGTFCNFREDDYGFCEMCPPHFHFCDANLTEMGQNSCASSCSVSCFHDSKVTISHGGDGADETFSETLDDVNAFHYSMHGSVTGRLVDCGLGKSPCEDAEGAICVIERGEILFSDKTNNCFLGGGLAAVIYNIEKDCENFQGGFFDVRTTIPAVTLSYIAGRDLIEKARSFDSESEYLMLTVEVGGANNTPAECELECSETVNNCDDVGLNCNTDGQGYGSCDDEEPTTTCTDGPFGISIPEQLFCEEEEEYCNYDSGSLGSCKPCPDNGALCFFSNLNKAGALQCNERCGDPSSMDLEAKACKFCPKGSFNLGNISDAYKSTEEEVESSEPCQFCAVNTNRSACGAADKWDMKYPNRTLELFGNRVECWNVAEFYSSLDIDADSTICASARSFNYICGCSDSAGYAGARNERRQIALAWLPRIGAILSILGSSCMILFTLYDQRKRKKVIFELIIFLSAFDIVGSVGYLFTSLPTPEEDYIYGAKGNAASCIAQGFFIQVGTISLYMNVSIAFYYYLVIIKSWREVQLKKPCVYYPLFVSPVVVGAIFAFAGIPYYDNAILWCNNSQNYWSEIPIAVAIGIATILMLNVSYFVWREEEASSRFRQHNRSERTSLSTKVFKQSLVYLGAFYLTWPAYLALQIMLANGKGYSQYGFILFAGTSATLQGFWNFAFQVGYKKFKKEFTTVVSAVVSGQSSRFYDVNSSSLRNTNNT